MSIYKPTFRSIGSSSISNVVFNNNVDASTTKLANKDACEITGPNGGTTSGYVDFNIKDELINNKPVSLFFNLNIYQFENGDKLNIQIDNNGDGSYVDCFEIVGVASNPVNESTDTNFKLKTFFYSQTENYSSSNDFYIRFKLSVESGLGIDPADYVYFDNMFTYVSEAINFFDGDGINATGTITLDNNLRINSDEFVGSIELFDSSILPANYILCDGTQISKSQEDGKYSSLIDFLNGSDSGSTCFLPNLISKHPLGVVNGISNYTTTNINNTGENQLDINYFPSHSHNSNSYTNHYYPLQEPSISMTQYQININKISNITIDHTGNTNKERGDDGRNLAKYNAGSHTHNITAQSRSCNVDVNYTLNYIINGGNVNATYEGEWQQLSPAIQNDTYDLKLESYKVYFGIRFK